jgi:hypothetical protein
MPFIRRLALSLTAAGSIISQGGVLRADPGDDNPAGISGEFNGMVTTGCSYDPYTGNAKRSITDVAAVGAVGAYPLAFTRSMNSRVDASAGVNYPFGKAGAWRHAFQWEIKFNTSPPRYNPCDVVPE